MKRYLLALGLLAAWACQGANPTFSDFSTNSFSTTANIVDVKPAVGFRFATRFTPSQAQMYFEGDSLTGGTQAWWFWLSNNFQRYQGFKRWVNYAHSGDTVDMTTNQWPTEMGTNTLAVGELGIAWYWIGANGPHGLQNYDPAEPQADMRWWTTNTQAKGYEVGWITILPQAYVSDDQAIQFEVNRQIMNNYMRTSSLPQYLIDAAALFPNPFETNFYRWGAGDTGVHLNTNAQAILADEVDRALRGWPRAGGAYAPPKVWQQVTTNYAMVDQVGNVLQRVDPFGRLFPNSVSVGTSNTITLGSDGVLTFLGLGSGGLVWRVINSGYGTVFYFGPDGSMFIGPNDASGGIQLYPNGQITAGGRLHIADDALFDGGTIYTTVATPVAATIGGTVGSVTNHMTANVSGVLMDYWSDGTSLWSRPLSPVFGCLHMTTTNTIEMTNTSTYSTLTNWTAATTNGFTANLVTGFLTNLYAGFYRVTAFASFMAGGNDTLEMELFVGASGKEEVSAFHSYANPSRIDSLGNTAILYLPANSAVSLRFKNNSDTDSISVWRAALTLGTP